MSDPPWVLGDDPDEDVGVDPADDSLDDIAAGLGGGGLGASRWLALGVFASAVGGAWFAGTSTSDFVAHLDRQVHAIHCAFGPGAQATLGDSGCKAVMMSP